MGRVYYTVSGSPNQGSLALTITVAVNGVSFDGTLINSGGAWVV
jgi:hypothetical protein